MSGEFNSDPLRSPTEAEKVKKRHGQILRLERHTKVGLMEMVSGEPAQAVMPDKRYDASPLIRAVRSMIYDRGLCHP